MSNADRGTLTRAHVAARLGVSLSKVRRWEGVKLHPVTGRGGVRLFDSAEVAALAAELANEAAAPRPAGRQRQRGRAAGQGSPGARRMPQERPGPAGAERTPGELAALVFERLERRESLAEIVVGLKVPPAVVRELHREWLVGLTEGELQRPEPLLPTDQERQARERHVTAAELARLLADLPMGAHTRISVAADLGEAFFGEGPAGYPREARNVIERGGFVVAGPIPPTEIARRYGAGAFRLTAYGFDPPGVRWEVLTTIDPALEREALAAVESPAALSPSPSLSPSPVLALPAPPSAAPPAVELATVPAAPVPAVTVGGVGQGAAELPAEAPPDWRGLRAELAAVLLPSPASASAPTAPRPSVAELPAADWLAVVGVRDAFDPDPPGLGAEVIAVLANLRERLRSIEPVPVEHLAVVVAALSSMGALENLPDPGEGLAVWSTVRARVGGDPILGPVFDFNMSSAHGRALLTIGGLDPEVIVAVLRVVIAVSCGHEIRKLRTAPRVDVATTKG